MWILMVEAGCALLILVFIVWWTMFSGRPTRPAPRPDELGATDMAPSTHDTELARVKDATTSDSKSVKTES